MRYLLIIAVILVSAVSSALGATLILEEGVNGYDGTRDTTLFQDRPANSAGGFPNTFSSMTQGSSPRRTLLKFDIPTTFPVGATITNVSLLLNLDMSRPGSVTHTLHKVTRSWNEGNNPLVDTGTIGQGAPAQAGDATWSHAAHDTTAWTTPGGDYVASPSATASVGAAPATVEFSDAQMAADFGAWVSSPSANHGWILIGDEAVAHNARRYVSSEGTVGQRPRLTITYAPPVTGGVQAKFTAKEKLEEKLICNPACIETSAGKFQAKLQFDFPETLPVFDPGTTFVLRVGTFEVSHQLSDDPDFQAGDTQARFQHVGIVNGKSATTLDVKLSWKDGKFKIQTKGTTPAEASPLAQVFIGFAPGEFPSQTDVSFSMADATAPFAMDVTLVGLPYAAKLAKSEKTVDSTTYELDKISAKLTFAP